VNTSEIDALLQLLQDDNPSIREAVAQRLRRLGPEALAGLEVAAGSDDPRQRIRARAVLQRILSDRVALELRRLLESPDPNLEEAVILLARVEHPSMNLAATSAELDRLGALVKRRLQGCATARGRALCLGRVIAGEEGFRGNVQEYYDPRNSYLDDVLRRRVGIPISLAAVYILAGRRAGMNLQGVGMPLHFLVMLEERGEKILLDPYGGGGIMTREGCKARLAGLNHSFREGYLKPVSDRDMLRRMLSNLVHIYHERDDQVRLARLYGFVNALQGRKR
jgi:regulator of sirC expression with transglutaminase-like and TPR domain